MNLCLKLCASAARCARLTVALLLLPLAACTTPNSTFEGSSPNDTSLGGADSTSRTNSAPSINPSSNLLRVGDPLTINFTGVQDPPGQHQERIKEDGMITLPLIGSIQAAGKTIGQLQQEITERYVPKYYKRLNVTIASEMRFFVVIGEVRKEDRHQFAGEMTVLKAIAAAGGFTDFAKRTKVQVTRANGKKITVDCNKAQKDPSVDVAIYPDDKIYVPRRLF
ncbi:MAG: polysaccharide export protein [Verrucomicrobia bacterium]|nr:polysaccharide export protein [Verrucomicrobiota bacterium]